VPGKETASKRKKSHRFASERGGNQGGKSHSGNGKRRDKMKTKSHPFTKTYQMEAGTVPETTGETAKS